MGEVRRAVVSIDKLPEIEALIRSLPAMLSGQAADVGGIAAGFRARIGWTFFSLVKGAFEEKSRGRQDDTGDSWAPLSPAYLAYSRRVNDRQKKPRGGGKAPGGKDGLLTKDQLALWNRTFAQRMAWYAFRLPYDEATAAAAAHAWTVVKEAGGKTKIGDPRFGGRQAGVDYSILVNIGTLRQSIQPGQEEMPAPGEDYQRGQAGQIYEATGTRLLIGTTVSYAKYHHHGKGKRKRRLWPEKLPDHWMRELIGNAAGGLVRIMDLYGGVKQ